MVSYNYETNDYYIEILSSAAYHNKEGAKEYISKITTLFRLITENFEEDKHKNDFRNILRALISPFTKINIKYPWLITKENWDQIEFQQNLWRNLGDLNIDAFSIEIEHITQEDIEIAVAVINDYIFPWINDLIDASNDKNRIKTVSWILTDVYSHICTLFIAKGGSKIKDFTLFYYEKQGVSAATIAKLQAVENELFNLAEKANVKIIEDDTLK